MYKRQEYAGHGNTHAVDRRAVHGYGLEAVTDVHLAETKGPVDGDAARHGARIAQRGDGLYLAERLESAPQHSEAGRRDAVVVRQEDAGHDKVVLQDDGGARGEYRIVCERAPVEPWATDDFAAVAGGYISLTPLHFALTSRVGLTALAGWPLADLLAAALSAVQ